ncbi:cupin domain-containing protein [Haloactinomyces albus]|uniref:Cupin superfamily protein n=1 Tax=Haloactinomyces albus TaxID=1352928 RepID=A0AAE3ZFS9_9ACTN|nr:cupin domain-containing protein [Haloactinomyces albus]MDR7304082.1 putative cupin superfamily protein [Haloactinomyces albus]
MYKTTTDTESFEPFLMDGTKAGEVHWITPGVSGIWRVLPGQLPEETPYEFEKPETIHVLEGSVTITTEDGESVDLRPGDIAAYSQGVKSTWHFRMPFRKLFIHA